MYTKLSAPLDVQWELTPWCTYNCVHCYNYWRRGRRPKRTLSADLIAVHRQAAQEIINNRVFHATLTGGEPLGVLEQVFPELIALKQAGVHMSVNSNLALLNRCTIELLQQLGVRSILTSLISADEGLNDELAQQSGAFRRTVAGIKLAVANGFRVSVNMVVSQKNFHTIRETGDLAYTLGARSFCATKVSKPSNCPDFSDHLITAEQIGQMFHELLCIKEDFGIKVASLEHYPACLFPDDETRAAFGNRNCSAAKTSCTLGFDGAVRPCSHAPMPYGNVVQAGLKATWERMDEWRDDSLVPAICRHQCGEYPGRCGGGCRIEALNADRGMSGSDPYCLGAKPVAQRAVGGVKLLSPDSGVRLSPQVRFRSEKFGHIAYKSSTRWVAIDSTLYDILTPTLDGEILTVDSVVKAYQCSEADAIETLSILKAKSIVELI